MTITKILIIGDLHGNKPKIHFKDFDYIIAPGDICSDKYQRKYLKAFIKSEWKKKECERIGFYRFIKLKFNLDIKDYKKFMKYSLNDGRKIMEYLDSFGKPVFFVPGNWDQSWGKTKIKEKDAENNIYLYVKHWLELMLGKTNERLIKNLDNIIDCHFKLCEGNNFNILGYGLSAGPEWGKKLKKKLNKKQYNELKKIYDIKYLGKLSDEYSKRNKSKPTILLTHNVPYDTKLDKITDKSSPVYGQHYGSVVARDFILKHKPLICIGGHMHEHFGKIKLGKTIVINVGFGGKVNTLLTLKNNKIKSISLYPKKYG